MNSKLSLRVIVILNYLVSNSCNRQCCIGVFYRPPDSNHLVLDNVNHVLCTMDHTLFPNFVLSVGLIDYNNTSHPFHHHLLGFMSTLCLTQVVSEPTHLSSHSSTLIDLVLLSQPPLLISCHTVPPLANSDHHGIHLKLKTRKQNSNMHVSRRKVWRYTHADFPKPNYLLDELDLEHIFVSSDIDQSWINWREAFLSIMDLCIPHGTLPTRKSLTWLTKTLINAMKKRNYYFRESKQSGDLHAFAKYKTL